MVRLIPTKEQERLFKLHVQASIDAWNFAIKKQTEHYTDGNKLNLSPSKLYNMFYSEYRDMYQEVSTQTVYNTFRSNRLAYMKFFKKIKGKPKLHTDTTTKSFYVRHDAVYFKDGTVNMEKIGKVVVKTNYPQSVLGNKRGDVKFGEPCVKFDGKYWILSVVVDINSDPTTCGDGVLGIDVGIKSFIVCSDGTVFDNINKSEKMVKLQKQIDRENHNLSRMLKTNGKVQSENVKKQRSKLNKLYRHQKGIRDNYIHQVSKAIIDKHPSKIVIEDLEIVHLARGNFLAKELYDQKIAKFFELLKYKAEQAGIEIVIADKYYPSSKMCCNCGAVKSELPLNQRVYHCDECGFEMDRDLNASINLRNLAIN